MRPAGNCRVCGSRLPLRRDGAVPQHPSAGNRFVMCAGAARPPQREPEVRVRRVEPCVAREKEVR